MKDVVAKYIAMGLACHWLKPHSKAPKLMGWSERPVATLAELRISYFPGNNLGVRVGKWSVLEPGFGLVVLDVDLRRPPSV
jgi:hypothetical protein